MHGYPREPYVEEEMDVLLENPENTVSTGDVAVDMVLCDGVVCYPESVYA